MTGGKRLVENQEDDESKPLGIGKGEGGRGGVSRRKEKERKGERLLN